MFFGVLQQKCGFADATCSFDADHAVIPVNLVHQSATDRGVCMLH